MRPASRLILVMILGLGLSACGGKGLRDLSDPGAGPEEFAVLPTKPLEAPKSYKALPTPTPGAANLVDATPKADAVAALGGKPARLANTGVARGDSALVAQASRFGVPANIRATTAQEDAEFRKRRSRFTRIRLFRTDRYAEVYRRQSLDPHGKVTAYRRAGIKTPSSPPGN